MDNVSIVMRIGGVVWALSIIGSFVFLYSSVSERRSLILGETIVQAIFCVVYWILLGTIADKFMTTGDNTGFYRILFYVVPYICFLRQGARLREILKK